MRYHSRLQRTSDHKPMTPASGVAYRHHHRRTPPRRNGRNECHHTRTQRTRGRTFSLLPPRPSHDGFGPRHIDQTEELRKVLDIAAAVLSGGPNKDPNDLWPTLRPSDWFRASTHILASVARGALRTKNVGKQGDFPLEPMRDKYLRSNAASPGWKPNAIC
jgi:hypothetical protein